MPRPVKPWTWRRALREHGPQQQGFLLTLYTLGTFMDEYGFAFPGQQTLARGARASVRTVRRHIEEARKLGWVETEFAGRTGQGWRHYAYRCTVPDHVALRDKDEALADAVVGEDGDIEREDKMMSPPSSKRADTSVASPSQKRGATCGHSEQKGGDIPDTTCGQAGGKNVRTQLVPTNSRSETPALTHASYEGGALPRPALARAIPDEGQRTDEIERGARDAARLIGTLAEQKRVKK